ncbi:MAG TPA: integrase arm-type DNA-binding domain-containing protein [Terracidiphilus sp.]|nr:integrase arm-type DNA-binding domain-containing protein [Terracidiphilus sp.]
MTLKTALSDVQIRGSKRGDKPYTLSDGGGLYLEVRPNGAKLWRYRYTFQGRGRLMGLGSFPATTLKGAREKHIDAKRLLESGVNPLAERQTKKLAAEGTFAKCAEQWLATWSHGKTPLVVHDSKARLERYLLPILGSRPIGDIGTPELVRLLKGMKSPLVARKTHALTSQVFRYAIAHGHAERNPASDFKPSDVLKAHTKKHRAHVSEKELPALLRAIEAYRGQGLTRLALKLLAMTFVRPGELIGAKWAEFDIEGARWTVPPERMKMRKPHIVHLSTQALDVLATLREMTGNSELVFSFGRDKPMGHSTLTDALASMGYLGKQTAHGFRHLASTLLHEQGWPHEHIELQLSHMERNAVSASYNHALYLEPRAKMMQHWNDFLEAQQRGKVVSIRTA